MMELNPFEQTKARMSDIERENFAAKIAKAGVTP